MADPWATIGRDQRFKEIEDRLDAIEKLLEIVLGTRDPAEAERRMVDLFEAMKRARAPEGEAEAGE